jgi:rubrerythrin
MKIDYLIKDERQAPRHYSRFLKNLSSKHDKMVVRGIIRDERRHLIALHKIQRRLKK